jgi:hypothetical protein
MGARRGRVVAWCVVAVELAAWASRAAVFAVLSRGRQGRWDRQYRQSIRFLARHRIGAAALRRSADPAKS